MIQDRPASQKAYTLARRFLAGGVSSPVRSFRAVGGTPIFFMQGKGSRLRDADGRWYIDYVGSWGPLILGHAPRAVVRAVESRLGRGTTFGTCTPEETALASKICQAIPSIERIRFVSSGTEAVMTAVRLARAFTKRDWIVKFQGCYHGHSDGLLAESGSGLATLGIPSSPGVPRAVARQTLTLPYNDIGAVRALLSRKGKRIAAILVEPVAANMGVVLPLPGFLQDLRKLTERWGICLIFDEIITGFRVAYGGAQSLFGIRPDLTTLGKIIGGGFPAGALGGRREIMALLAPVGPVYQAGTLSGHPLAMVAGRATLEELARPGVYENLERGTRHLSSGLHEAARDAGEPVTVSQLGSMLTVFFCNGPVEDFAAVTSSDTGKYRKFFWLMADQSIYVPPSQFEAWFVSSAHDARDIEMTIRAARKAFREIRRPKSEVRSPRSSLSLSRAR